MVINYYQDQDNHLAKLFKVCLILVEFSTQSGLIDLFEGPLPPVG